MFPQELPIDAMLPRISLCRLFDTQNAPDWAPRHRIASFYELSFYLEGSGIVTIDDNTYCIRAGDIRFNTPGTHLYGLPHFKSYTVYFDFGQSDTPYKNAILEGIPAYFHTNGEPRKLFEELLEAFHSNDLTAPIRQNALLLTLLAHLFELAHSHKDYCPAVRICLDYMAEHYSHNITLETLSSLSGYSTLHIQRLFKQDLGCSPHDYLTSLRINRAKKMLTETDYSVSIIAAECGFSSDSHFKTLFRNITGLTPGRYRKSALLQ